MDPRIQVTKHDMLKMMKVSTVSKLQQLFQVKVLGINTFHKNSKHIEPIQISND